MAPIEPLSWRQHRRVETDKGLGLDKRNLVLMHRLCLGFATAARLLLLADVEPAAVVADVGAVS